MSGARRDVRFWGLLGEGQRTALTAEARPRVFSSGAALCTQGEPTTHVFIVLEGWVKILSVTSEGSEMLEAIRGQGDVVGEIAGAVTGYRTATVRAIGTVRSLIVGAERFGAFLDAHPGAAVAYRRAMAERSRAAYESQRNQVLANGAQRLARLVLDLAEQHGHPTEQGIMITLPLSQEELASLAGSSRATVTRALSDWRSRRIIRTRQRHVIVLDQTALQQIAGQRPDLMR